MTDSLTALAGAIGDVGYWRWWASAAPRAVQLEFGGVQLAHPARGADAVPEPLDVVALRFVKPSAFAFLTRLSATAMVPADWPAQLAADSLDPESVSTALSYGMLSLGDEAAAAAVLAVPHRAEVILGGVPDVLAWRAAPARVAFWAGAVGAVVLAARLEVVTREGPLALSAVPTLTDAWWLYWRAYWARRGTERALPYDAACEVTIPMADPPQQTPSPGDAAP